MNVAIFGESSADEAALAVLVEAVLGSPITRSDLPSVRARGWSQMLSEIPRVIRALHFNSDAEALIIAADSNGDSVENMHSADHDLPGRTQTACRFCSIRSAVGREFATLPARPQLPTLRVAVGLAIPTIEAWLLSPRQPGMTEANWRAARQERPPREPYSRKQLKKLAYGKEIPTIAAETRIMTELMTDAAKNLKHLETAFPGGFAPLKSALESWKSPTP